MAKPGAASKKRPVEQYEHKGKKRANNPPVGLVDSKSDAVEGKKTYAYDPHLDPTLVWAGKAERTSFEIPTVSLHVHERIDPRAIIEAVRKKNGSDYAQLSLFGSKTENPPLREAIEFYKHAHNWSNRFIAGDSLLVMNSLLEKEGTVGKAGEPGEQIRNVISVGMLSEGWDAKTVTHIMGLRAFSSQLLCEQVAGRGLRRTSLRPVFLWADEAHNFVSEFDSEYQAVARSAGGCTVYLTQNRESYKRVLGNDDAVDSLLGNLQAKFFCQNSGDTNEWAAKLLGERYLKITGANVGRSDSSTDNQSASSGISRSEQRRYFVEPARFTTLKRGGVHHGFQVEAIVYNGGHRFPTGEPGREELLPYKLITFNQR